MLNQNISEMFTGTSCPRGRVYDFHSPQQQCFGLAGAKELKLCDLSLPVSFA